VAINYLKTNRKKKSINLSCENKSKRMHKRRKIEQQAISPLK